MYSVNNVNSNLFAENPTATQGNDVSPILALCSKLCCEMTEQVFISLAENCYSIILSDGCNPWHVLDLAVIQHGIGEENPWLLSLPQPGCCIAPTEQLIYIHTSLYTNPHDDKMPYLLFLSKA